MSFLLSNILEGGVYSGSIGVGRGSHPPTLAFRQSAQTFYASLLMNEIGCLLDCIRSWLHWPTQITQMFPRSWLRVVFFLHIRTFGVWMDARTELRGVSGSADVISVYGWTRERSTLGFMNARAELRGMSVSVDTRSMRAPKRTYARTNARVVARSLEV